MGLPALPRLTRLSACSPPKEGLREKTDELAALRFHCGFITVPTGQVPGPWVRFNLQALLSPEPPPHP